MPAASRGEGAGTQALEAARARAAVYGLLARVFAGAPAPELLAGVRQPQMREALAAAGIELGEDFFAGDAEQLARRLAVEYARLFIGPGAQVALYESFFVRGEGEERPQLWGEAAVAVAAFCREVGLETAPGRVPDHVSHELEVMAVLSQAEAESLAASAGDEARRWRRLQVRFCQEHLGRWLPDFSRAVARATGGFYRGMALLAEEQVRADCEARC